MNDVVDSAPVAGIFASAPAIAKKPKIGTLFAPTVVRVQHKIKPAAIPSQVSGFSTSSNSKKTLQTHKPHEQQSLDSAFSKFLEEVNDY